MREWLLPIATKLPLIRRRMLATVTGLDHALPRSLPGRPRATLIHKEMTVREHDGGKQQRGMQAGKVLSLRFEERRLCQTQKDPRWLS